MEATKSSSATQRSKKKTKGTKKNEVPQSAPIFLRKTYELINTCDPEVASWSPDGMSFVVKDVATFETKYIPQFFNHRRFSSFVRQLNFYSFKKQRHEPLRLKDAETDEESKYCRFYHEKFRRGRPDLLSDIRKASQVESADKQEVELLRQEVTTLKRRLSDMSKDVEGLKKLVGSLIHEQHLRDQVPPEIPTKRLRLSGDSPCAVPSNIAVNLDDKSVTPLAALSNDDSKCLPPEGIMPNQPSARSDSVGYNSFTSQDEAMLTSLFALDPLDEIDVLETGDRPIVPTSMPTKD